MYVVAGDGQVMNWTNILDNNLLEVLKRYIDAPPREKPLFYMSTYLLDMVSTMSDFLELKLMWGFNTAIRITERGGSIYNYTFIKF